MKNAASDVEELDVGDVEDSNGFGLRKALSGSIATGEDMVQADFHTGAEKEAARAEGEGKNRYEGVVHEPQRGYGKK